MPSGGQNKISRRELVRDLTGLAQSLGKAPAQSDYKEYGKFSRGAYETEFGSWSAAKETLGIEVLHRNDTRVTVACEVCDTDIEKKPSRIEDAEYLYCSRACQNEHKSERYSGDGNPRSTLEAVECENCGDTLQRADWERARREHHFCDYDCMGEWREGRFTGEDHPRSVEYATKECEYCGASYTVKPSEEGRSRFCSRDCLYQQQAEVFSGEGSPVYSRVTKECDNCGEEYEAKESVAEDRRFCSTECFHEIGHPSGEDHPLFDPDSERLYYGPNWTEQRMKAVIRDNGRCQIPGCEMTVPDHLAWYGRSLDVHHKRSLRAFKEDGEDDEIDYDVANDLSNLVSLCRDCHRTVESESHSLTV